MKKSAAVFVAFCLLVLPASLQARDDGSPSAAERDTPEQQSDASSTTPADEDGKVANDANDANAEYEDLEGDKLEPLLIRPIDMGLGIPKFALHGFGDVGYNAEWVDFSGAPNDSTNYFLVGGLDIFITAKLSDDFSFLSETDLHFSGSETELDVERLLLMYEYRDWLKVNLGRGHTALGYWNRYYHHGAWLQTTINRPLYLFFEHDGGILPVHFVGFEVLGNVDVGVGLLSYVAFISNGRGQEPGDVQITEAFNPAKAAGFLLRYSPNAISGLGFGVSGYFDEIPADDAAAPARPESMREYIYSGHLFYVEGPWELLAEGSWIIHDDRVADTKHRSAGAYGQVAYRWRTLKPYYRFDWMSIAEADPFYALTDPRAEDTREHTVGVRWDVRAFVAFKLEYRHRNSDSRDVNALGLQAAFAF